MAYEYNKFISFDAAGNAILTATPTVGDNSNKIATTSFVATAVGNIAYNPASVSISGGQINNTSIGTLTPNTAQFTTGTIGTLTANGASNFSGTFAMLGGLIKRTRVDTSGAPTISATDQIIIINNATPAATAVTLPATPATGRRITIKDGKGDAATNAITITPATGTVDGLGGVVIGTAYGTAELVYNGAEWSILTPLLASVVVETPEGFTVTTAGPVINASQTTGTASTGPFYQFSLVAAAAPNNPFQVAVTPTPTGFSAGGNVIALVYHLHACFQHATDNSTFNSWWYWSSTINNWQVFEINSLTFTNGTTSATYTLNAPAQTIIGTLSIPMSDGSAFNGVITLSDNVNFVMFGLNLESKVPLTANSYSLNITATPSVVGQPFGPVTFTLTHV